MKACKTCIHVEGEGQQAVCLHPLAYAELPDFYEGTMERLPRPASMMRSIGTCGREGNLWEGRADA